MLPPVWRLDFVPTAEGFYSFTENRYIYQYRDHLGNARISYAKKLDGSLEITDKNDYYPFGLNHIGGSKGKLGGYQNYKYNGKEIQETGMYDYGARFYMPDIGRWGVVDKMSEKYNPMSSYNYAINNPVNVIDPDGNDIYIVTWFSKNDETGHAGIAVDNYKTVTKKDANGKVMLDSKGKPITEQVKDGTMTYYDLWPEKPVGQTQLQDNVKDDYNGKIIKSLSDLMNTDVSKSGEKGKVSENGEGRAADGIVKITSDYNQDTRAKNTLSNLMNSGRDYNACSNNCSTFVQNGIKSVFPSFDASQLVKPSFPLNQMYNDARVVAPNNLYNGALKIKGASSLKGSANGVKAKPYLEYFGKSNRP